MGIYKFNTFFSSDLNTKNNIHKLSYYSGKTLCVDATHILYKKAIGIIKYYNKKDLASYIQKVHLYFIFNYAIILAQYDIKAIFIFDGCIVHHGKKISISKEQYKYMNSDNQFKLNQTTIDKCVTLLSLFGFPSIIAYGEADAQLAQFTLSKKYNIYGVITDDTDILVYGGTRIIKKFSSYNNESYEITLSDILNILLEKSNDILLKYNMELISEFKFNNFIDFAILMGSDYHFSNDIVNHKIIFSCNNISLFELFVINNFDITLLYKSLNSSETEYNNLIIEHTKIFDIYTTSKTYDTEQYNLIFDKINIENIILFIKHYELIELYINIKLSKCKTHEFNKFNEWNRSNLFTSKNKARNFSNFEQNKNSYVDACLDDV